MANILLVDDEEYILRALTSILKSKGHEIYTALGGESAFEILSQRTIDAVVCDYHMEPVNGLELLERSQTDHPNIPFVFISGVEPEISGPKVVKAGAFDFLPKPLDLNELADAVSRAITYSNTMLQRPLTLDCSKPNYHLDELVAESEPMQKVCSTIEQLGRANAALHIYGPPHVGKTQISHSLHNLRYGNVGRFIHVSCESIDDEGFQEIMFERENGLFPDEGPGAPKTEKPLNASRVYNSTIYFSSIEALSPAMQEVLLQLIKRPSRDMTHSVSQPFLSLTSVISSSSVDLGNWVERGLFLPELFRRIAVVKMHLGPLSERPADILPIFKLAYRDAKEYEGVLTIDQDAKLLMEAYRWPGNVPEVRGAARYAGERNKDHHISVGDLPETIVSSNEAEELLRRDRLRVKNLRAKTLKTYIAKKIAPNHPAS